MNTKSQRNFNNKSTIKDKVFDKSAMSQRDWKIKGAIKAGPKFPEPTCT